jgi:SEC-C motif-containing protein
MLRTLNDAGYDPADEREMQAALFAYNAALMVWGNVPRKRPLQLAQKATQKAPAGRNDPCPCGSGKKYKKCCLDTARVVSVDGGHGSPNEFGPAIVPRLFDRDATFEDIRRLSRIMDRDPAFASIGFSAAEVGAFMGKVAESEPAHFEALQGSSRATIEPILDDLSARFRREYGDRDFGRSAIKDKCVAAAKRAASNSEVRALATGVCLAVMGEASNDPADDPLADILFRKALFSAVGTANILDKVMDALGGDENEIRRLIEAEDPSVVEKIKAVADELSTAEEELLRTSFDKSQENLWDTITANEFPVPPPFAAQMAMLGQVASVASAGKAPSKDEVSTIVRAFSKNLTEEDYVLYGQMLDGWLRENKEQSVRIVEAVKMMRHLCMIRSIEDVAPSLFARCLENARWMAFDGEEQKFIANSLTTDDLPALAAEYGAWLKTKGYPGMAERLVRSWDGVDLSRVTPPARERRIA